MRRQITVDDIVYKENEKIVFSTRFIPCPLKKNKQKCWRAYRNSYLKNKASYGIYVYNGVNEHGYVVLTRTN